MKYKAILVTAVAIVSVLLVGCGGGVDAIISDLVAKANTAPVTSTQTFQLRAADVNYFNDFRTFSYTLQGTVVGVAVTGSGTVKQGSVASGTFEGAYALTKTSTVTGTVTANGITKPMVSTQINYADTNYLPRGSLDTEYSVISGSPTIPLTAKVNDTGVLFTANRYSSSSKTTFLGTTVTSYVMKPDTATTALLITIHAEKNTSGVTTATSTVQFRITTGGAITRMFETYLSGADSLTMTY